MSLQVRTARRGDGGAVANAWVGVGAYYAEIDPEHFQEPDAEGLAALFEREFGLGGEDRLELVVERNGEVVGWLLARLQPAEEDAAAQFVREHGWNRVAVDGLIVHPDAWRVGAGTALLQAAEAWGRERDAEVIRLDTYAESPVSVPFYEALGYARRSIVFQKSLREPGSPTGSRAQH